MSLSLRKFEPVKEGEVEGINWSVDRRLGAKSIINYPVCRLTVIRFCSPNGGFDRFCKAKENNKEFPINNLI